MSHELRTPLHCIIGYAGIGIKKVSSGKKDKMEKYFREVEKGGNVLLDLINDLLDLAKLESGKTCFEFQDSDLFKLIDQVIDETHSLISQRNLQVNITRPEAQIIFPLDAVKLMQVIRNLMSNAIKYSPENGVISIHLQEKSGAVTISVTDEGVGIPESELEAVFDKFAQSSKTKDGSGGTGLGLSISQEIIEAHKGKIWAENNPDCGAKFIIELPTALS